MKIRQRKISAVIGVLTSVLTAGATLTSAQATPSDKPGNGRIAVTPGKLKGSAPHLPSRASAASVAAPAPTTTPAASYRFFGVFWAPCEPGFVCTSVPYANGWYHFGFFKYGTYRLSYWYGATGYLENNQTGGAAVRLLDSNGGQITCLSPKEWWLYGVDWTPVWYIKLTSTPC